MWTLNSHPVSFLSRCHYWFNLSQSWHICRSTTDIALSSRKWSQSQKWGVLAASSRSVKYLAANITTTTALLVIKLGVQARFVQLSPRITLEILWSALIAKLMFTGGRLLAVVGVDNSSYSQSLPLREPTVNCASSVDTMLLVWIAHVEQVWYNNHLPYGILTLPGESWFVQRVDGERGEEWIDY